MINRATWRISGNLATRFVVPATLLALSALFALWHPLRWGLAITLPLLLVALWDFFQRRHTLRRRTQPDSAL